VHVIHQSAYIADSYRFKDPRGRAPDLARWQLASRVVDYGLLVTSLYPIASFTFTGVPLIIFGHNLSSHGFETGGQVVLFPDFLKFEWLGPLAAGFFFSVRLCSEDGVGVAGGPAAPAEDDAHERRLSPLLHNAGSAEPARGLPGFERVTFLPVPRGRPLPQPCEVGAGPDRLAVRGARLAERTKARLDVPALHAGRGRGLPACWARTCSSGPTAQTSPRNTTSRSTRSCSRRY
jgi:hypothetical protein